jgi:hypothetical protein
MARVIGRVWRLLVFLGLIAASLTLAEARLGRGEPFCGQHGSIHWCAEKAADFLILNSQFPILNS